MSRTHKDRPVWVKLNDRKTRRVEEHNHHRFGETGVFYKGGTYSYLEYCTIDKPQEAVHHAEGQSPCYYYAAIPKIFYAKYGGAHKKALHMDYWNPLRAEERTTLTRLKKEYYAMGEVDEDIYLPEKTRNTPYGGGYWD